MARARVPQLAERVGIEGDELLELDVLGAEVVEEVGEDALRCGDIKSVCGQRKVGGRRGGCWRRRTNRV
jgi:hypothetical protein